MKDVPNAVYLGRTWGRISVCSEAGSACALVIPDSCFVQTPPPPLTRASALRTRYSTAGARSAARQAAATEGRRPLQGAVRLAVRSRLYADVRAVGLWNRMSIK